MEQKIHNRGRKKGDVCKYTVGIGYVVAYRQGRNVDQIAKFFKANRNAVVTSLKRHGVDLEKTQSKKIKKLQATVNFLQDRIAALKAKKK